MAETVKTARKSDTTRAAAVRKAHLDPDIEGLLVAATDVQRVINRELKQFRLKMQLSERGLHIINLVRVGFDRPSRLIEYFDVLPSTITADVEKLVAAGLLMRQAVPSDRRVIQLVLTDRGLAVRKEALALLNSAFRARLGHVAGGDLRICVDTLRAVVEPLEPGTPPSAAGDEA
jgi:DNA-binding MarR family transcriptional regulator